MNRSEYLKQTLKIAWPCVIENVMVSAVSMVNVAMVGSLGKTATSAVAVNSAPNWLLNSLPLGFSVGGTVLVARKIGAEDKQGANDVASQTLGAGFLFAVLVFTVMLFLARHVPALLNADLSVRPLASTYLRITTLSIIPYFSGLISGGVLRGSGDTKTPMLISLLTNVLNITSNFFLIFPVRCLDFPGLSFTVPFIGHEMTDFLRFSLTIPGANMGVLGAAISTACAQTISGTILILMVCGKSRRVRVNIKRIFKLKKETVFSILGIGVPAMAERVTISLGQIFYSKIVNSLGTTATAAHYVAVTAESIAYMPANAFSVASTTLVGQALGAKDKERAQNFASTNILCGLTVGLMCFAFMFFVPGALVRLFSNDPDVIALGSSVIKLIAPFEPFCCMLSVFIGILRGGGDTKFGLVAGLCGMWIVRLGMANLMTGVFGLGLIGAWIGMGADNFTRFTIMFFRYRRKKWLRVE